MTELGLPSCRQLASLAPLMLSLEQEGRFLTEMTGLDCTAKNALIFLAFAPYTGHTSAEIMAELPNIEPYTNEGQFTVMLVSLANNGWLVRGETQYSSTGIPSMSFQPAELGSSWVMPIGVRIFCLEQCSKLDSEYLEALILQLLPPNESLPDNML